MHPNRIFAAVVVLAAPMAWAQVEGTGGGRAPTHGIGAIERRGLELGRAEPAWDLAAVRGVPARDGPLVLPPARPDEPLQIGVNARPPSGPIRIGAAGEVLANGKDVVWRIRVDVPGAGAVRLRFTGLELPAGASIVAAGKDGAGYVIRGWGSMGSGTDWTPVLDGEHAFVECRGPASASWLKRLAIEEVAEIAAPWPPVGGSARDLLPCHVDVQCQTVDATARDSVGAMVYSVGPATFACTGALLNDTDPGTTLGWFLTSRQCINTQAAADSLTVYWFYMTPECNGTAPPVNSLPVSSGATLLVQSTASDVSFLKLAQNPANGQGLAGWTTEEPTGTLWTMHHPLMTYKRVSRGLATTMPPICFGGQGYYQFHYVDYTLGITETGSTGAPLFNSNWQVTGQLAGACAVATPTCSNPSQWSAVFGRFSRSFPLVSAYLTGQSSPGRVYVNAAATGAGTGLTWADAYPSLATALTNAAPGVGGLEVWVAQGAYKPAGAGREAAFQLLRNVRVYGGFAGGETLVEQRDFVAHPTVLSGDLGGDDAPNFANRADNAYHVVRGTGVDSTAELDGFFIRGGSANGPTSFNDKGGGLYVEGGSPKVRNCTFLDNDAGYSGGAVAYYFGAVADLADCTLTGNRANFGGAVSLTSAGGALTGCVVQGNVSLNDGGGLDLYESNPTVSQCTFKSNTAVDRGGGVSMFISSAPMFVDCRFESNSAAYGGGGAAVQAGGATFTRCVMIGNSTAHFGGGFLQTDLSTVAMSECRFLGNLSTLEGGGFHGNQGTFALANCEFSGNKSTMHGGGAVWQNEGCQSTLLNCTISRNVGALEAGGIAVDVGATTLTNCILWGNTDSGGSDETAQVQAFPGTITVSYSRVQGWTGTLGGAGNSGNDPLLVLPLGVDGMVGTEDDDLGLSAGSSAIDSGNSTAAQALVVDVRGHARKQDDPCTVDAGTGPSPIVDIGAIETSPCGCYANCDGSIGNPPLTPNDFLCFLDKYAANDIYANCDGSTGNPPLTPNDFLCFLDKYVAGCS